MSLKFNPITYDVEGTFLKLEIEVFAGNIVYII